MNALKSIFAGAVFAGLCFANTAQAGPWMVEANGASVNSLNGAELGVGYNLQARNFRFTPILGGLIYQADNDRYRSETSSSGNEICRDRRTGYFANKEKCDNAAAKAYGKLEAAYRFKSLELGGGARISGDVIGYGQVAYYFSDQIALKAFGGQDYYGAGLTVRF